jgi:hypothetical protein
MVISERSQSQLRHLSQIQTLSLLLVCLNACSAPITPSAKPSASLTPSVIAETKPRASARSHSLNLSLEPIAASFYEVRWQTHSEAYVYRLWLDGKHLKENLVLPHEIIDLKDYALGTHQLKLESISALGKVLDQAEIQFEIKTGQPSAVPLPTPAPQNSTEPTAPPLGVAPEATATPVVVYLPTPWPTYTSDSGYSEKTIINGVVFDDNQQRLGEAIVKVKSLNSSVPYEATTLTSVGTYLFNNAPPGVQVEVTASKPGYTTRKRVEVLKSNKQGDPNANRYDFGADNAAGSIFSAAYNALSDKPEVIRVTPARNGSGVYPQTNFILTFSEPMDTQSVEDAFAIYSFNSRQLSVDSNNPSRTHTVKGNSTIATNFLPGNATQIWDKNAFISSWNPNNTEVTFNFKAGKSLPTDKDSNLVPDYNLAFYAFGSKNRTIKDKAGNERQSKHFKLTDGDFEESFKFGIKSDENKPTVVKLTQESSLTKGSAFGLIFNEAMLLDTQGISIAGGMADLPNSYTQAPAGYPGANWSTAARAAQHYSVKIANQFGETQFDGLWSQLGGRVEYAEDPTRQSVRLSLPPYSGLPLQAVYLSGGELLSSPGTYHTGVQTDQYSLSLLLPDQVLSLSITLNANLANNSALAQDLQAKLNSAVKSLTPPPSLNPFRVRTIRTGNNGSPDIQGVLGIAFLDSSQQYLGFAFGSAPAGNDGVNDVLPQLQVGGLALVPGLPPVVMGNGYSLEVKVGPVMDPAGNTVDTSRNKAKLILN